jgi:competence protein ComEA
MTPNNCVNEPRKVAAKLGYKVVYVPHSIIEDYNATYNVIYEGKVITTNASKSIGVPINEIWISQKWKPYEKYILFHEIKEIQHKAAGLIPREAHKKASNDALSKWKNDPKLKRMIKEIRQMDRKTRRRKLLPEQ